MQDSTIMLNPDETNDPDLVELAGYHAYRHYTKYSKISVNGKEFEVKNTSYNTDTGLDALTVQNVESGEFTVVFVGSEQIKEDWIQTNANLLSEIPPAQIKAANDYFVDMEKEFGQISHVTGNSLAGALTNSVAIENPDVTAVTLNPAVLPPGMVDPNTDYPNITNYYSQYDFLTGTQESLGIDDRIPGSKYNINNGLPIFSMFGANHTGYVNRDSDGEFKIEVGVEGEPGHGFIHVGADDHIVTSLWTGVPLYGGSSIDIAINQANMELLAKGIQGDVTNRLNLAGGYLNNSVSIVQAESDLFNSRVTGLQDRFSTLLDESAGEPMFNGLSTSGYLIKSCIDELLDLLNLAEEKSRGLNSILNSKPSEIIEHLLSVDISVESLFAPAKTYLYNLRTDVDNLTLSAQNVIQKEIPDLFQGGTDAFVDAVVGELNAHYDIIERNKVSLQTQITDYGIQVHEIGRNFDKIDRSVGGAITANAAVDDIVAVQKANVFPLEDSPYMEMNMKIKNLQVEIGHGLITSLANHKLLPIVVAIEGVLILIEIALEAILLALNSALYLGLYGNPVSLVVSLFTDYDERVKKAAKDAMQPITDMEATVEGLRKGFGRMIVNFPNIINDFKPYLDTAIFEQGNFSNVRLYNIASAAILDEMEIVFNDIIYQLSGEQAEAIDATVDVSKSVLSNIQILKEQVGRGTL